MTNKWVRDTGVVFALVFLVIGFKGSKVALVVSALLLLAVLFAPSVLRPLARVWKWVAEMLGRVMNKVFFGLVFFIVIVPVGYLKRRASGDSRHLRKDPSSTSAFIDGKGQYAKSLFTKPF
jgi:hypothetical protein